MRLVEAVVEDDVQEAASEGMPSNRVQNPRRKLVTNGDKRAQL